MHEVSIAHNILEVVEAEARKENATAITKIRLKIGTFTGVVREALEFAFDALKPDTLARGADIEIEIIPLKTFCKTCQKTYTDTGQFSFICLACGDPLDILQGREMEIDYIEVD